MKLNWDSLIDPIFLFMLYLISGTLWVIIPFPSHAQPQPPPLRAAPPKPVVQSARTLDPAAQREGILLARSAQEFQQELESVRRRMEEAARQQQQTSEDVRKEEQRLGSKQQENRNLQNQVQGTTSLPAAGTQKPQPTQADANRLEADAREKEAELARRAKELAQATGSGTGKQRACVATPTSKEPIPVELVYNRVVPIDEEHFRITVNPSRRFVLMTRKDSSTTPGESPEQIRKPNSVFAKYLQAVKPETQYLVVLLNNDSFAAFRAVEEMARARGFNCGVSWIPTDSKRGTLVSAVNGKTPDDPR